MEQRDIVVVGGGASGLSFAWHVAAAGREALVLEQAARLGGCLDTRRCADGFWFELGAHTIYNSYGGLLKVIEGCGLRPAIRERGPARKRFALLRDGRLSVMGPLSVFLRFDPLELALSAPFGLFSSKLGKDAKSYYGKLVGPRNYAQVLGPFLAAVPSQSADCFPAEGPGSLFKKRPRRQDLPRSFTLEGGLSSLVDAIAAQPKVSTRTGAAVQALRRTAGGFELELCRGEPIAARIVALAVPPSVAAELCRPVLPGLAEALGRIGVARSETVGVVVERGRISLPEMAFLVPVSDLFFSAVTRDPVAGAAQRAFAFHFRPGLARAEKLRRIAEVLSLPQDELGEVQERTTLLPAPRADHGEALQAILRALGDGPLALLGNYFEGMALEDCVARAAGEARRVAGSARSAGA